MASKSISDILSGIETYRYHPQRLMELSLNTLENITGGTIDLVDASNPFVFALENAVTHAAAFMAELDVNDRRQYPIAAQTRDDLYLHMSDKDYVSAFATPSTAQITIWAPLPAIEAAMVADPITGGKKITIPRNTAFTVASTTFSLQYPVEVSLLPHGGWQVRYNTDQLSPLYTLPSNLIDHVIMTNVDQVKWLQFSVDVHQFDIVSEYNDVSASAGFVTDVAISDQFYYARVWKQFANTWVELQTTYNPKVFDINTPTAYIQLLDGKVRATIPPIYANNGSVYGRVRVDVYQTKGKITLPLKNHSPLDYSARWINVDTSQDTVYTAAMGSLTDIVMFSTTMVDGGTNMLSFAELKSRVIRNALGDQFVPITNAQLQATVENLGFSISTYVDTLTNRIFLATKPMPDPTVSEIYTPASAAMSTVSVALKDAALYFGAIDNGDQVTLSSSALYTTSAGITKPVLSSDAASLMLLPKAQLCRQITNGNYSFSPFTYVLDAQSPTFELRAYYLDSPRVSARSFVQENETTGYQVALSNQCTVVKTSTGYRLFVQTQSSDATKALPDDELFAQLSFQSVNQVSRAYLNGVLYSHVGDERVYSFQLDSRFKIDANHRLTVTNFTNENNGLDVVIDLTQTFDVVFATTAAMPVGYTSSSINLGPIPEAIGFTITPISQQRLTVVFGSHLKNLWSQARSVVSTVPYDVYTADEYMTYAADVYQQDGATGTFWSVDAQGHLVVPSLLHRKGDPVLNTSGQPVVAHYKGEVKLDANGNPIMSPLASRYMIRMCDMFLLNACYYFATDSLIRTYLQNLQDTVVSWINDEMTTFQDALLDQTKIYYKPLTSKGVVQVTDHTNNVATVETEQVITVKFYMPKKAYLDTDLTKQMRSTTIKVVSDYLKNRTCSISQLQTLLTDQFVQDIVAVEVSGLGGSINSPTLTLVDPATQLSLKKKLSMLADGSLTVEEDITIIFNQHGT